MEHDRCPRCANALRILRVRFNWTGTRLLYACPTCRPVQDSAEKAEPPSK